MEKWEIPAFRFKALPRNVVRNEWIKYKRNLDYIIAATGEQDQTRIKNIFIAKAGPDLQEIFSSIPGADVTEDKEKGINPYKAAIEKLDAYFSPKQHETFERNVFWMLRPDQDETLEKFMLRCQDQASKCNFGSTAEDSRAISVIDKVILFAPNDLKEHLLQKDSLKIDEVAKIITSYESVKQQAQQMNSSVSGGAETGPIRFGEGNNVNKIRHYSANRECIRCGKDDHLANDPGCPAKGRDCNKCKRTGHFAAQCRTSAKKRKFNEEPKPGPSRDFKRHRVRQIDTEEDRKDQSFIFSINDGDDLLWMKVGGIVLQFLVDSGCKMNIINDKAWEYIKNNGAKVWNQQKDCREVFLPYGKDAQPLTVLGKFDAEISLKDRGQHIEQVESN